VSSVFVILNEWTNTAGITSSQIVDSVYFTSESVAWDALKLIADSYETHLAPDETSISLEDHSPHIPYEEYYIQELTAR
jgi:hypothetical protein